MKNILFVVCTHGNETAPLEAIKNVIKKYGEEKFNNECEYVIANPKALEGGVRFIETDLNRIYPGDINGETYEERRAAEILEYAKNFKYVIDIHTTISGNDIFTIVTKDTKNNNELASKLSPKKIIIWESISGRKTGPVTSFLDNSCEIECSVSYPDYMKDLEESIISAINILNNIEEEKEWYRVVGSLSEEEGKTFTGLKDFCTVEFKGKRLYPFFVNRYSGKACYFLEKMNETKTIIDK